MDAKAVADAVNGAGVRIGVWPSPDELLGPLISEVKTGDVVLIMSNGAVGNLHRRLLDVLAESKR
jgi:UDP-N-acetylmuramate-alanine ligase